jgi:hypothetical protein
LEAKKVFLIDLGNLDVRLNPVEHIFTFIISLSGHNKP